MRVSATSLFALLLATAAIPSAVAMPLSAVGVAQVRETARIDAQEDPDDPQIEALMEARVEGPRLFQLASSAAHVVLVARIGAESFVLDILKADRASPIGGRVYAMAKSPQATRGVIWAGTATASSERWGRGQHQVQVSRRATAIREAEE